MINFAINQNLTALYWLEHREKGRHFMTVNKNIFALVAVLITDCIQSDELQNPQYAYLKSQVARLR